MAGPLTRAGEYAKEKKEKNVFFRCVPLAQAYFTLRMQQEMLSIEREYVVLCHGIPGYDLATSNSSHEAIGLLEFCFSHGREDQERIEGQPFEQP